MNNGFDKIKTAVLTFRQQIEALPSNFREMRTFSIVWFGQCISVVGSGLTQFAIGLWVYQQTGSVTRFALIALASVLPHLLLAPLAGVLVDRWNRRYVMILSDVGAGLSTLAIAVLFFTNRLDVWQIYLATAISAACNTFQWPAYTASITLLVPKHNLGRANGMVQLGQAVADIFTPVLAGVLLITIRLWGILLIDFLTFLFAVGTLALVKFPFPQASPAERLAQRSVFREARDGWRYIVTRPGLVGLLIFFAIVNFLWGTVGVLIMPMILNFASPDVLGVIISVAGGGVLLGSVVMSIWGGPQRRINGVIYFELFSGLCFMLIGLRPYAPLVALGAFGAHLTIAIISGSNQAIWQTKIAPEVQGRVFAFQHMLANSLKPLAFLLAGPLADRMFEPLMAVNGQLAGSFGTMLGIGPGRGIGLLFVVMGFIKITVSVCAYLYPHIRRIEDDLPDMVHEESLWIDDDGMGVGALN